MDAMTANTDTLEEYVFVYGTLRQQGSNAWRMQEAKFVTAANTKGNLYRVDWYPAAIFDHMVKAIITGELYSISAAQLEELDVFEGKEYHRIKIKVSTEQKEIIAWAWEYLEPVENLTAIISGDWLRE